MNLNDPMGVVCFPRNAVLLNEFHVGTREYRCHSLLMVRYFFFLR